MCTDKKIEELVTIARGFLGEKTNIPKNLNENELLWGSSIFITNLLLNSNPYNELTKEAILSDIETYNFQNGTNISFDELYNKAYVRIIFNCIKIPHNLLWFCKEFSNDPNKIEKYKDNSEFHNFLFLAALYKKYGYEDSRQRKISLKCFEEIYKNHQKIFPAIPNISYFLENQIISKDTKEYSFSLFKICNTGNDIIRLNILQKLIQEKHDNYLQEWLKLSQETSCSIGFINKLPYDIKIKIQEDIIELLKSEKDILLIDSKIENRKIYLDAHRHSGESEDLYFNLEKYELEIIPEFFSLLDFYWKDSFQINHYRNYIDYISQEIRNDVFLLERIILENDDYFEFKKSMTKLFSIAEKSPCIFINLQYWMKRNFPEKFLYLIENPKYGLLAYFLFMDSCFEKLIRLDTFGKTTIFELIKNSTEKLFSSYFSKTENENFYSLFLLYFINKCFSFDKRTEIVKQKRKIFNFIQKYTCSFISKLDLDKTIELYNQYKNIKFEDYKLSLINLIFNLSIIQNEVNIKLIFFSQNQIQNSFVNFLSADEIQFSYDFEDLRNIDLTVFFIKSITENTFLEIHNLLLTILDKINTLIEYPEYKLANTISTKIRTFLYLLTNSYLNMCDQCKYDDISKKIEFFLTEYFEKCFVNKNFCIFSNFQEYSYIGKNNELLPLVLKAMRSFSEENKHKVVNAILNYGNLTNVFTVYNNFEDDEIRNMVENYIQQTDFSSQLDDIHSIPNYVNTLVLVLNSNIAEELFNKMFNDLNKIINKKIDKGMYGSFIFDFYRLKAFVNYKNNDINALNELKLPQNYSMQEDIKLFNLYKQFYQGLYFYNQNDKQKALEIINQCIRKENTNLEFFFWGKLLETEICIDKKETEKFKPILTSIENKIENILSNKSKDEIQDHYIMDMALFTKLKLLHETDISAEIDFFYTLPSYLQSDIDFAYLAINDLIALKRYHEAEKIFLQIKNIDKTESVYVELDELVNNEKTIHDLQSEYSRIISLSKNKRFKVIPESILSFNSNAGDFILSELIVAFNIILEKHDLIKKLKTAQEDNISDLLQIALHTSLNMLDYQITSQNRSGSSASGINAGETDLSIRFNNSSIILEAVRYSSGNFDNVINHILKNFDYGPSKKFLFNLVYYQGDKSKFTTKCNEFKNELQNIQYPTEYEFNSFMSIDDTEINNDAIFIIKCNHNNDLIFYHIILNFSYADK